MSKAQPTWSSLLVHFITFLNSNNSKTAYPNITTVYIFEIREIWSVVLAENIQGVLFELRKLLSKFDISNDIWHFWHSPKDNTQEIIQLLYLKFFSSSFLNICKTPRKYKEWPCTHRCSHCMEFDKLCYFFVFWCFTF